MGLPKFSTLKAHLRCLDVHVKCQAGLWQSSRSPVAPRYNFEFHFQISCANLLGGVGLIVILLIWKLSPLACAHLIDWSVCQSGSLPAFVRQQLSSYRGWLCLLAIPVDAVVVRISTCEWVLWVPGYCWQSHCRSYRDTRAALPRV